MGAILIDDLEIENIGTILDFSRNGELAALPAEFKLSLNEYLSELSYSPVRSLLEIIEFDDKHRLEVIDMVTKYHSSNIMPQLPMIC